MIIHFETAEDFIAELTACANDVDRSTVRAEVAREPDQDEGITHTVGVWWTAMVADPATGQRHLIQFARVAGQDTKKHNTGTETANAWTAALQAAAAQLGLTVRPGRIETFD